MNKQQLVARLKQAAASSAAMAILNRERAARYQDNAPTLEAYFRGRAGVYETESRLFADLVTEAAEAGQRGRK